MDTKTIEVRDTATFMPVMAIRLRPDSEQDRYLFARAGFGMGPEQQGEYVILVRLERVAAEYSPVNWGKDGTRTMMEAHKILIDRWDEFPSGAVLDVQYELGETKERKDSERGPAPLPWEILDPGYDQRGGI